MLEGNRETSTISEFRLDLDQVNIHSWRLVHGLGVWLIGDGSHRTYRE